MINVKDLYDKVNSVVGISQKDFISSFNETVLQLLTRYGEKYVFENTAPLDIESVDDTSDIYAEWRAPILNYVIYQKSGDQLRRQEYDTSLDYAYRTVWRQKLKKKRFKTNSWI